MGTETLPGQLRLTPSFPFVGRPREMAALQSLLPRARGEGRRIALVGGEAGSGKTRLVREFAGWAADAGAIVLYGSCEPDVSIPYRPVAEAIDQFVQTDDPSLLQRDLGASGGELTRLVPRLADLVADLRPPVSADQDTERLRLHQSVADLLVNLADRAPTVLILEDAHWADAATLGLLRYLSRAAAAARLLVIATFRDLAADVPASLSSALVELRRSEGVVPVRVGGISALDIEQLITLAGGKALCEQLAPLAAEMHELTDGLPFLVIELWRELLECGAVEMGEEGARLRLPVSAVASPEAVREVVSQRLGRLDTETNALLELAAVIGPEFDLALLAAASGADDRVLHGSLDQADLSGMITPGGGTPPRYRFTHELVRRALYDRLPAMQRADLHLRAGEALEASGDGSAAELAHHFTVAVPRGGTERAVAYNLRAAEAASAALAFDQAAAAYQVVLDLGVAGERERARVQLQLGEASFRAGASEQALDAYEQVFATALEIGDGELAAGAAVGFESACWRMGSPDSDALRMLLEAEQRLDPRDSSLRVVVLSGLARAYAFRGNHPLSLQRRTDSLAMARRLGDRTALARVSMQAYWARASSSLDEILAMLDEALRLAAEVGDIEIEAEAREWRVAALIAKGDLESARRENSAVAEAAVRTRQPFVLHVAEHYKSTIALCDGDLAGAEQAAERSFEWGNLLTGRDPTGPYGVQMFSIRREQGRLAELAPVVRILAARGEAESNVWAPGLAAIMAELGMTEQAHAALDDLRSRGLDGLRFSLWMASLTYLTDAAYLLDDRETAALVLPELEHHTGEVVAIGHGVACYGSVDRYLGMLAATLGDHARAAQHFEIALEVNGQMRARTWQAHTGYVYGRLLARTDRDRSRQLLREAAALATDVGMPSLLERIAAVSTPASVRAPDELSPREVQILREVARGRSNREIGTQLSISQHTVANHVRSILRKTRSANRTEATAYAHRRGLADERPRL